jgi:hypothetical protein
LHSDATQNGFNPFSSNKMNILIVGLFAIANENWLHHWCRYLLTTYLHISLDFFYIFIIWSASAHVCFCCCPLFAIHISGIHEAIIYKTIHYCRIHCRFQSPGRLPRIQAKFGIRISFDARNCRNFFDDFLYKVVLIFKLFS